jgi:hypothetical protein
MSTQAEALARSKSSSYNYYPNTMITLCMISYSPIGSISLQVQQLTDVQVVWGPAQLVDSLSKVTYALAYVAYRPDPKEYTVVIRGTTLDSATAWLTEDFEIGTTVPFTNFVANAPSDAAISKGTSDGINDLLSLGDPITGATLVQYLQTIQDSGDIYVTGHSLGGTLVPPMLAYINDVLYGGGFVHNMALWSFAGLTPGNGAFNTYFSSLGNPLFPFRIYNTLDIAPLLWWNQPGLVSIYAPAYPYGDLEAALFDPLFDLAAGIGYAQPASGGTPIPGTLQIETGLVKWLDQAAYQHHSTTYQTMVAAAYPQT